LLRQKEEGRRKKEEGRRKKEEGRRKSRVSAVIKNILTVGRGCSNNTKRLLFFNELLNNC
jgi:hypothetical protein